MYCNNCGYQSQEDFRFCPKCGTEAQPTPCQNSACQSNPCQAETIPNEPYQECENINPAAQTFLTLLQDKLFFVICILMTVSSGASVLMGDLPVVEILITVFLWLVYAQSDKGIADAGYLRCVSGAVYANYVITNVLAVILAVCGLILGAAFSSLAGNSEFMSYLQSIFAESAEFSINGIPQALSMLSGSIFAITFLIIAALIFVANFFTTRYLHRFAQSVYKSIQAGVFAPKHTSAARVVLIIFAVFAGLSALGGLTSFHLLTLLSSGASCCVHILAVLLINRHLLQNN